MSCEHFRRFIDESTAAQMKTWIEKQTLIARAYLSGLRRRLGPQPMANLTPIELPDEDAIVNETFKRILGNHDEGYVWDGAGAFDAFFRRCLKRTMESLRSDERKHKKGAKKLEQPTRNNLSSKQSRPDLDLYFCTPQPDYREIAEAETNRIASAHEGQFQRALTDRLGKSRIGSKLKTYVERLRAYSRSRMTTEEIARDLGVKPGTIGPYRYRMKRALKRHIPKDTDGD
jgi:DNA-directed RNA polymerase specialized sigma24 family protein